MFNNQGRKPVKAATGKSAAKSQKNNNQRVPQPKRGRARPQRVDGSLFDNLGIQQSVNNATLVPAGRGRDFVAPFNQVTTRRTPGLRVAGRAQANADIGGMNDSVRIVGSDLFATAVQSDGSTNKIFNGNVGKNLGPSEISSRLAQYEEMYQYYAIRELKVTYTNDVGASTAGSLAAAIFQSATTDVVPTTQQQILEADPCMKTAVWQPESMLYRHTGTKLWNTTNVVAADGSLDYQGQIVGLFNGVLSAASLGTFWMDYVIDFYKPIPVQGDPSLRIKHLMKKYNISISDLVEKRDPSPGRKN